MIDKPQAKPEAALNRDIGTGEKIEAELTAMIERWVYRNETGGPVRVLLHPSRGSAPQWLGDLPPGGATGFRASTAGSLEWLCVLSADGNRVEGPLRSMGTKFISEVADVLGVSVDELVDRWHSGQDERERPALPEVELLGTEKDSDPGQDGSCVLSESFRLLDRGGLHARPSVLITKALAGLPFRYVLAEHPESGRRALLYGSQESEPDEGTPKPLAFWLLLLRLGARRSSVVKFTVCADTTRDAQAALDAVSSVLSRAKPSRFGYWRELGLEGWSRVYLEELASPEARSLAARHQLFDKADQESGPDPPAGSPMATPIHPHRTFEPSRRREESSTGLTFSHHGEGAA